MSSTITSDDQAAGQLTEWVINHNKKYMQHDQRADQYLQCIQTVHHIRT